METIFSERHILRNSKTELFGGQLVEPFERPSRAEYIIGRVREVGLGHVSEPEDFGMSPNFGGSRRCLCRVPAIRMVRLAGRWVQRRSHAYRLARTPYVTAYSDPY